MTKKLFFALTLFAFVLTLGACSDDGSKEVIGGWKSIESRTDRTGAGREMKIPTLLIREKTLTWDGGNFKKISFEKKDGKIVIFKPEAGPEYPIFIVEILDNNTAIFSGLSGPRTYVRITPEEVKRIDALPNY